MKYALITPVLNEESNMVALIDSILIQTKLPDLWVFVDDGCTDRTIEILENYQKQNPFIKIVEHHKDSGYSSGSKIAKAVLFGIDQVDVNAFDIITKIDADLIFPADYFEKVLKSFEQNDKLGLCGGVCALSSDHSEIEKVAKSDHVRGALKSYRTKAYLEMGGIKAVEGWDSLDELLLRYYKWDVKVLEDQVVYHQRKTDTNTGMWKAAIKSGRSFHVLGYNFPIAFFACIKLTLRPPYIFAFFLALYGYLGSVLKKDSAGLSKEQKKFINSYRWNKILKKI